MKQAGKLKYSVMLTSILAWLAVSSINCGGNAPDQPVAFSHETHAGKFGIDCQYCHTGVTHSAKAGVPSANVCANCHNFIAGTDESQKVEIKNLMDNYIRKEKSPDWVRVHNTPDFVRFAHAPHVKALLKEGKPTISACKECHGDVDHMKKVKQVRSLNMGDCVNCHRDFRDDHHYKDKGVTVSCSTCHY